jgi:hypothetical protein
MATMKLRAQILIDIDADDFVAAADHQRRIETLLTDVKRAYDQAELVFRERRPRGLPILTPPPPVRQGTGHLHVYEEG